MLRNSEFLSIKLLNKFLCFSEKNEQKIDYVRFLTKIYRILFSILDMELIFGFDFFSKIPVAKKVLAEKQMLRVVLNFVIPF